jgi:uncharacterized secreted protein with C-terminal beta-propeller domain
MKKVVLLAIVISGLMTSCKKDRTCECSITETFTPKTGSGGSATSTSTTKYTKASKQVSGVRDCVVTEETIVDQDGDKLVTKADCKLK